LSVSAGAVLCGPVKVRKTQAQNGSSAGLIARRVALATYIPAQIMIYETRGHMVVEAKESGPKN